VKRKLAIAALVLLAFLAYVTVFVLSPLRTTRQLRARYQQVRPGMSAKQVAALMAYPSTTISTAPFPAWDDASLPPAEASRITSAVRYTVRTFYMPVSYEFSFDVQQRVVGRHIYD
jgi:hypothetical protein